MRAAKSPSQRDAATSTRGARAPRKLRTLALCFAVFCAVSAHACSIPVFRYALDRWPADRYRLEVSAADAKDESIARFRRNFTDSTPLNLEIVAGAGETSRLLFPHPEPGATPAWSGTLDAPSLGVLVDSPARKELVRRILAGESCVWVLVESGNADADSAAAATLEKRLRYLQQIAQIPPNDPTDPSSQLGPGPTLAVKFSMLRVRGDEVAEQTFLKMLAGPKIQPSGTWVAAVFGRGRVLGAWPAAEVGDEQIDEVCLFLLGACSCQVKRQNPGWDLLLTADWDTELQSLGSALAQNGDAELQPAKLAESQSEGLPQVSTATFAPSEPAPPAQQAHIGTNNLAAAAGALLVLGFGLTWWSVRRP